MQRKWKVTEVLYLKHKI